MHAVAPFVAGGARLCSRFSPLSRTGPTGRNTCLALKSFRFAPI